jgi:hypothetical protein
MSTVLLDNYITCHMIGRLGNQMFQVANAYTQAALHKRRLILPLKDTAVEPYLKNVFSSLQDNFVIDHAPVEEDVHVINGTFNFTQYYPHPNKCTVFRGFYQSEKYFIEKASEIKKLFGPTKEFVEKAYKEYPQLTHGPVVGINVRRGDYLNFPTRHPVITLDYIYEALKNTPEAKYHIVVSDDIEWCKENIKLPNCVFATFVEHEALWLLSLCHHFVISNSSFSWWGAYLSNYINKVVVTPDTWVGPDIVDNMQDVWCPDWVKIPTQVKDGQLFLK